MQNGELFDRQVKNRQNKNHWYSTHQIASIALPRNVAESCLAIPWLRS